MVFPSRVRSYGVLYMSMILLAILCPVYPASVLVKSHSRQKRAIPLIYVGAIVSAEVYSYLVATFGAAVVIAAGVKLSRSIRKSKTDRDNHSCRGNRGWCRPTCRSYEREYFGGNFGVCGSYKCCVPT